MHNNRDFCEKNAGSFDDLKKTGFQVTTKNCTMFRTEAEFTNN